MLLLKYSLGVDPSELEELATGCPKNKNDINTYYSLPSLIPLVLSLPTDAWIAKASRQDESRYIIELTGTLTSGDADVTRCSELASYVYILGYATSSSRAYELHPSIYGELESLGILPLPNLRSYCIRTLAEFSSLNRVAGSSMKELDIASFASLDDKSESFSNHLGLGEVVYLPKSLHAFRFLDSKFPKIVSASLMNTLKGSSRLKFVHLQSCEVLDKSDFKTLLSSESVKELDLGVMNEDYLSFVPLKSSQRLSYLNAIVYDLDHYRKLLEKIGLDGTSQLRKIRVQYNIHNCVDIPPRAPILQDFFDMLPSFCDTDVLKEVSVCFRVEMYHPEYADPINQDIKIATDTLSSLFAFKNLKTVNVRLKWKKSLVFHCFFQVQTISDKEKRVVLIRKWIDIECRANNLTQKQTVVVNFTESGRVVNMTFEGEKESEE